MAKMDAATIKAETKRIKEILTQAKTKPYNFAMLMSKDGIIFEADKRKPTPMLRKLAKANGGGPKGATGTLTVKGAIVELACEADDVPTPLAKQAKAYLQQLGLSYKFNVVLPSDAPVAEAEPEPVEKPAKPTNKPAKETAKAPSKTEISTPAPKDTPIKAQGTDQSQASADAPNKAAEPVAETSPTDTAKKSDVPEGSDDQGILDKLLRDYRKLVFPDPSAEGLPKGMRKRIDHLNGFFDDQISGKDTKRAASTMALLKKTLTDAMKLLPDVPENEDDNEAAVLKSVDVSKLDVVGRLNQLEAEADDLLATLRG